MNYSNWHVGMKVVFSDPEFDPEEPPPLPVFGDTYTISWIGVCDGDVMIDLLELPTPETEGYYRGFLARCFRPVQKRKTDISIFTAMLDPTNAQFVEAMRAAEYARQYTDRITEIARLWGKLR